MKLIIILWGIFLTADKVLAGETSVPSALPYETDDDNLTGDMEDSSQETEEDLNDSAPPLPASDKKPIEITADNVEQEASKNIVKARGNVVIRHEKKTVRADYVVVNTETGVGEATGHVIITDEGSRLKADRSPFNLKTNQGKLYNVQGYISGNFGPNTAALPMPPPTSMYGGVPGFGGPPPPRKPTKYYIKGKELTKLGENHYYAKETSLTTCTGALPDWLIHTDSADMKVGDRALFTGGTLKVRNVPVIYLPIGYVPLDNKRKSGFLTPALGTSNINGFTANNAYYWAIDDHSDATFYADYMAKRGVRPSLEYRYTPSKTTKGIFNGTFLNDNETNKNFYKVNWLHSQVLPEEVRVNGKLDLVGSNNMDKTFNDNTVERTKRNSDSFLSINKNWANNSLDVITRYRQSTEDLVDDTFGLLPQATFKTQRFALGKTPFYFNQDTTASVFYTDLVPTSDQNDYATIGRFDFHPQLSLPLHPAAWLSMTPTVGVRETYYSKGLDANRNRLPGFSRELYDAAVAFEGPKVNKVYHMDSEAFPKIKHVLEPRLTYNYIPYSADDDRDKIKIFDGIDNITGVNQLAYSLTQRLLQKRVINEELSETNEILKFEVSQIYNIRDATQEQPPGAIPQPFSIVQLDFTSRLIQPLMLNFRTGYDPNSEQLKTFNIEVGVKPTSRLMLLLERRYTRDLSTFIMGTADFTLGKGWRLQYSSRYDELLDRFQENDVSVRFDDPCRCWGMSFDFIKRNNINLGVEQPETKFMFRLTLRGLGTLGTKNQEKLIHRYF